MIKNNPFRKLLDPKKAALTLFILQMLIATLVATLQPSAAISEAFQGEIRITPEGTVEGTDKIIQNGNLYTLREDIAGNTQAGRIFISIEKDNVTFDGEGHTIEGTGSGTAISAWGRKDLTIKNMRIVNFGTGIEIRSKDLDINSTGLNNRILDNYFETAYWGISINTNDGFVGGNTIHSKNTKYGMLFESNRTHIANNEFINGGLIMYKPGTKNTFSDNTINGKPLVCLYGQSNQVIQNANQVILVNCYNMIIKNIKDIGLRQPIQLFGTTNTKITNCPPHIALTDSHSNTIIDNQLTEEGSSIDYFTAAIKLTNSNNNTIKQNQIQATNCFGINLVGSSYNHISKNDIYSSGADKSGIRLEDQNCDNNYIYDNDITSQESGISLRNAKNTYIFRNIIDSCKDAILLSCHDNYFIGNNISGSTRYGIYLSVAEFNIFYYNNFFNNSKQAYENHNVYWWYIQNDTYYSENNKWDNGKKGNYWSDYTGQDSNGDGIGETPYNVYEDFNDNYPLTNPYDISRVTVDFEKWIPAANDVTPPLNEESQIAILNPENTVYNTTSVFLEFAVSQPTDWLGYSLDGKANVTIVGNITLNNLDSGTHSITVYGNATQGEPISSETIFFTINAENVSESFPTTPVLIGTAVAVAAGAVLIVYFKKFRSKKHL